jgi:Tol biopolymer transport system component/DNA-binding winged helix-turn-helix (wHTH) protein
MSSVPSYVFGPYRLDVSSLQLWRGDALVPLPPKVFDTLLVLIAHRDRLVTKDELLAAVWPNSFVSEESVAQNITSLRRALVDDHAHPTYIATIARRGYRFIGSVTELTATQSSPTVIAPAAAAAAEPRAPDSGTRVNARWRLAALAGAAAAVLMVALIAGLVVGRSADGVTPLQLNAEPPAGEEFVTGVFSPDGASLLVVAEEAESRVTRLALRPLAPDQSPLRVIPESEGAARPFWSPDGATVAFFARGRLKKAPVDGGSGQNIAAIVGPQASGGSWGSNDQILFANYMSGIFLVDAAGGEPRALTQRDPARQEVAHRWPQWLPDSREFLYTVVSGNEASAGTFIASAADAADATRIIDVQGAVFVPPGFLVYVRDRVLMAQRVDVGARALQGTPITLAGDVLAPTITNNATLSASANGLLAFSGYHDTLRVELGWVNRRGEPLRGVKTPTDLYNPSLSLDERLLVAGTGRELWLIDLERDAATRLGRGNTTAFSPDGRRLAYTSGRTGAGMNELYLREPSGAAAGTLLLGGTDNKVLTDWSRDGRFIVYCSVNEKTQLDIWAMPTTGHQAPITILATPSNECQGRVSPDGRWMAYTSDETGAFEIYVQAFDGGGGKRVVSVGGGSEPQWSGDGRELFYVAADATLMAVAMPADERAAMPRPAALFRIPVGAGELNTRRNHYLASANGERFLVSSSDQPRETLNVLVNWTALLD